MALRIEIMEHRAIALYNADKKEIVGIFKDIVECAAYVYPKPNNCTQAAVIASCARRKGTIKEKPLGFRMAIRFATDKQKEAIPDEGFIIYGEYKPHKLKKRFTNLDASTLAQIHNRKSGIK